MMQIYKWLIPVLAMLAFALPGYAQGSVFLLNGTDGTRVSSSNPLPTGVAVIPVATRVSVRRTIPTTSTLLNFGAPVNGVVMWTESGAQPVHINPNTTTATTGMAAVQAGAAVTIPLGGASGMTCIGDAGSGYMDYYTY